MEEIFESTRGIISGYVMIVNHNADMRAHLMSVLHPHFWVVTASNGMDALHKMRAQKPDIVISDIKMPIMDGIQFLAAVKQDPRTEDVPVILLGTSVAEDPKVARHDTGADDYLVQPVSPNELIARVNAQLSIKRKQDAATQNVYNAFNDVPFAVAVLRGHDLVIDFINQYYLDLWQQEKEDVIGKPLFEACPEMRASMETIHKQVFQMGHRFSKNNIPLEFTVSGKTETRYFDVVIDPVYDQADIITGQIVTSIEVTEKVLARRQIGDFNEELEQQIARRTAELEEENKQLVFTNNELESFNYIASHDLQAPLRKIKTFLDLLDESWDNESDRKKYMTKAVETADRMSELIQSILRYSSIARTDVLDHEEVDLNETLATVKKDMELQILQAEAVITSCPLPVIWANGLQMEQLFTNLLSNSIKYSKEQPVIAISSRVVDASEVERSSSSGLPQLHQKYTEIRFADNGIGFDSKFKEKIFMLFQRLHLQQQYSGSGIGLSIVKKIVEQHNGCITAHSEPGKGATFCIWLPI